jgi:tRNA G46 methylase TrmB
LCNNLNKASADADTANWLAIELRTERAYRVYTKGVQEHTSKNLAIFSGDAVSVVGKLPSSKISQVFINHPEPPGTSQIFEYYTTKT